MVMILIIDDDEALSHQLELGLSREDYIVASVLNGKTGLERALKETWDFILLEPDLPELNGMEILRRIRKASPALPIFMISGRSEIPDKISALDMGANDYLTKPFNIEELMARIRTCLRFKENILVSISNYDEDRLSIDGLSLNRKTREVTRDSKSIELTVKEFDLLVFLIENKPNVVTREQIIQLVWGYNFVGDTNIVDVYIRYLRKKIDYSFKFPLIQTIRGVGYCIREEAEK